MKVEVRIATDKDAHAACEVLRRSIIECCAEDHRHDDAILSAWLANKTPQIVAAWFTCESNYAVVALSDEAVVGVALLARPGKIALCYVAPEARHAGVGLALLGALETQAVCWKFPMLRVASTATAKEFYLRNGYAVSCDTTSAFGMPAVSLTKRLPLRQSKPGTVRTSCCRCVKDDVATEHALLTNSEG